MSYVPVPEEPEKFPSIPDELLPDGISGASWDPELTRTIAEAKCRHRFDHTMEMKAWLVLHLLNERDAKAVLAARLEVSENAYQVKCNDLLETVFRRVEAEKERDSLAARCEVLEEQLDDWGNWRNDLLERSD